jgi:hypothetical protein
MRRRRRDGKSKEPVNLLLLKVGRRCHRSLISKKKSVLTCSRLQRRCLQNGERGDTSVALKLLEKFPVGNIVNFHSDQ